MSLASPPDVVVVDDDDDGRAVVARLLSRLGLDVIVAEDGRTGLQKIRDLQPHLAILDVVLPDHSGFEILDLIRQDPTIADMGVLMLSSFRTTSEDRARGIGAGADGYLFRPIDHDELVARVRAQLRQTELLARLKRSEARFRSLINTQADAVLVVGGDGTIEYANPSADLMLGDRFGGLVGSEFGAPISTELQDPILELRTAKHGPISVSMNVATTEWEGRPASIVSLRDMRRRLVLDEQLRLSQRLESVGRLTGGVAHDFNNLVSVILGAAEEIQTVSDGDVTELTAMIISAAQRGAELTRSLLAFASRQFLAPIEADVGHLLAEMLPMLRRALGDTIEVVVDVPKAGALPSLIDRAGFESAILNLCVNSRDAMESGGTLRIRADVHVQTELPVVDPTAVTLPPGDYVRVDVIDSGAGIAGDELALVFEPFFTTKPPGEGTGLGLPMVYGFARQSEGLATIRSELGVGTIVSVYLPRLLSRSEPTTDATTTAGTMHNPTRPSVRLLLVEDEEHLRILIARQLTIMGYTVDSVGGVDAALDILARHDVDVVLSDIRLGGMTDGRELAAMVHDRHPDVTLVLMSGLPYDVDTPDYVFEVLQKPLSRADITEVLTRAGLGLTPPG